ncbi:hypothetical protein GOBAR_AA14757 [Gossypium barbadense]|uniref:BHLH domain-containing protein n=1 Tax=Gossypium barbadense TaxID=3634 RepID=A0A2P5XRA4_GOSBA|nr:hypothetical protein GOBAR_AA14757 [Gossypium barbadense]
MASNPNEASADDFLEQILGFPNFAPSETGLAGPDGGLAGTTAGAGTPMFLQLSSGDGANQGKSGGFLKPEEGSGGSSRRFRDEVVDGRASSVKNVFHGSPMPATVAPSPHPPTMRPRVRARRGQATDPHSIAERLRRERIAERIRALQELVPSVNKSNYSIAYRDPFETWVTTIDLLIERSCSDEIVDYVKFLRLQVKVLSMSRLGGAGAVAPLVTDIPLSSVEDESGDSGRNQPAWEKWSNDGTERQVAKLMEENVGAAMQFLQSKALCIMPISLATAIYHSQPPDTSSIIKPETDPPP